MWWMNFYFDKTGYSCDKTSVGYVHDIQGRNWGRIQGQKNGVNPSIIPYSLPSVENPLNSSPKFDNFQRTRKFMKNQKYLDQVNQKVGQFWRAEHHADHEQYTLGQMNLRMGRTIPENQMPKPQINRDLNAIVEEAKNHHQRLFSTTLKDLPENLDWRNVDGQNFVSPVDDQAACGSCYSFAAMGLMEARVRVQTNNVQQPIFSEQEVITCGREKIYNQGCSGGFAYQTAGKYAYDFGVVEESCASYNPASTVCPDTSNCRRWYTSDYGYIGGYYGATIGDNGQAMIEELQNGPVAVGFNVLGSFDSYKDGVYVYEGSELKDEFNPFVPVNHAVLCVGYGVCDGVNPDCGNSPVGTPYWIVKNSWGATWGNNGFFLILRGVDEVGIESIVVKATVVPQYN